ncbi:conserved hypothetical protein [Histoplasma capsulatum var. duboisii H88]|uniref:Low temperature requirement A n=2 Tax=Ajellomyces capsulatus TaxID=5037 RepID=F0UTR2_AJEC8|nr:conserved hypothetical protein [Histoplasma capsulatum H143]EGC49289.1 conserved hypothetical protein [Histoplasma capsulatum var. duboisii H88]
MKFKNIFQKDDLEMERRAPLPWISNPVSLGVQAQDEEIVLESVSKVDTSTETLEDIQKEAPDKTNSFVFKQPNTLLVDLFYDLFFAANLAGFTLTHEINNTGGLKAYAGYISLLWFVWVQTTFFDLRFYTDSVLSRLFKILHLGVVGGFTILGPNFDSSSPTTTTNQYQNTSFVLMSSRVILVLQYGSILWYIRGYKRAVLPILMVIGALFVTAMSYMGLAFAAIRSSGNLAFVACFWEVLSFKETAIVQRFKTMTLIILGIGFVGMARAATRVAQDIRDITSTSIGLMISYFFVIIPENWFSGIRQQIWTLVHLPLHMGILLAVEGCRGWIMWDIANHIIEGAALQALLALDALGLPRTPSEAEAFVTELRIIVINLYQRLHSGEPVPDFTPIYEGLLSLNPFDEDTQVYVLIQEFFNDIYFWVMRAFGIPVPRLGNIGRQTFEEQNKVIYSKFYVLFGYFFIGSGLTLVLLALLRWLGKARMTRGEMLSIVLMTLIGTGVTFISFFIPAEKNLNVEVQPEGPFSIYLNSRWIVPTVALIYAFDAGSSVYLVVDLSPPRCHSSRSQ